MPPLRDAIRNLPDAVFADLHESADAYLLVVDLSGVEDDVTVAFEDGHLVVEARRRKEVPGEFTYRREERPVFLDFELPLPSDVRSEDGTAVMEGGVLEVQLPRTTGGRRIPVEG